VESIRVSAQGAKCFSPSRRRVDQRHPVLTYPRPLTTQLCPTPACPSLLVCRTRPDQGCYDLIKNESLHSFVELGTTAGRGGTGGTRQLRVALSHAQYRKLDKSITIRAPWR
jgi:hypothetical protein